MSRLGKLPVAIPSGVEVTLEGGELKVKGPKGTLTRDINEKHVNLEIKDGMITLTPTETPESKALWGTYTSHARNMIEGVTEGFTKVVATIVIVLLAIIFVGYILIIKLIDPHVQWPPTGEISQCPDYWTATSDGCCLKPSNAKNKFIGPDEPVCFTDDKYTGEGGLEAKRSWVEQQEEACRNSSPDDFPKNMCKLYWDGITNSTLNS